ncbi:hypothetical protein U9M48_035436 [Paspalum notatum var. saurae]|uniref:Reverse transcriptase zinc-binding domain-containing protein n=1 Tax=Paspalum notatum var. saurae TaxID=547442 RepID=A0AAQ3UCM0_PASNO
MRLLSFSQTSRSGMAATNTGFPYKMEKLAGTYSLFLILFATEEGFLSPLRGRYAKLRLSLYADDAVIFINPLKQDVDMTIRLMQRFGDATGLRINLSKSSVAAIRCQDVDLDSILSSFSGQRVEFPITYLGMPLSVGRLRLVHLEPIKDKAVAKLSGWQCKLLSPGGRRVLVRSVLSSLPVYLLTVMKPPKAFIKDFDKIRRRFLWAGNQQLHGGKCKVSWARLQRPINRGGLGIINLELFGRALRRLRLWFEWKCPEKPWVGMELPIDDTDRALFAAATRVMVNNGQRAKFWHSSWINGVSPALLFPELFKHSKRKNRTVAEALRDDNWIRDILHDLTVGLLSEYTQLWELVESVHFNHESAAEDTITWTRTASGEYSASSAYKMQFEGGLHSDFPHTVWLVWAPAKCKFFLWLLLQNRVWTADRLLTRQWPNSYFCPMCYRNLETARHLFSVCPETCKIWTAMSRWLGCQSLHPNSWDADRSLGDWFYSLAGSSSSSSAQGLRSLAILVVWSVWSERNARIFKDEHKTIAALIVEIKEEVRLWSVAGAKHLASLVAPMYRE